MLFCCLRRNVGVSCHKQLAVISRHRQKRPIKAKFHQIYLVENMLQTMSKTCFRHVFDKIDLMEFGHYQLLQCHQLAMVLRAECIALCCRTARDGAIRYWLRLHDFCVAQLHLTPPLGVFPLEYCHDVWCGKTRMVWLLDSEKKWIWIYAYSFQQSTNVTDGLTLGLHDGIAQAALASRGNKQV